MSPRLVRGAQPGSGNGHRACVGRSAITLVLRCETPAVDEAPSDPVTRDYRAREGLECAGQSRFGCGLSMSSMGVPSIGTSAERRTAGLCVTRSAAGQRHTSELHGLVHIRCRAARC